MKAYSLVVTPEMLDPQSAALVAFPGGKATAPAGGSADAKRTLRLKAELPARHHARRSRRRSRQTVLCPVRRRRGSYRRKLRYGKGAQTRAEKLMTGVEETGTGALDFDPVEWRELQDFKRTTGLTLAEAKAIVERVRGNLRLKLTVDEAIAKFAALRVGDAFEADSISHTKKHLARFAKLYGPLPLFAINTDNVRGFVYGKPDAAGRRVATILHAEREAEGKAGRRALPPPSSQVGERSFRARAAREMGSENPCAAVASPKVFEGDVTVLSAKDCFALLKANRDEPVIGRMALELFGGMRCSSVERVTEAHVNLEARGLEMKARLTNADGAKVRGHKSGKRKYRQGHPAALWAWLEFVGPKMYTEVAGRSYDEKKRDAFIRARATALHNVLRHSFASYLLAATKNQTLVSYLMQHDSLRMTEKYEGVACERDAKLVLAMTPASVLLTCGRVCEARDGEDRDRENNDRHDRRCVMVQHAKIQQTWGEYASSVQTLANVFDHLLVLRLGVESYDASIRSWATFEFPAESLDVFAVMSGAFWQMTGRCPNPESDW